MRLSAGFALLIMLSPWGCDSVGPRAGTVSATLRDTVLIAPAFLTYTLTNDSRGAATVAACAGRPLVDVEDLATRIAFDPPCDITQTEPLPLAAGASYRDSVRIEATGIYRLWFYVRMTSPTVSTRLGSSPVRVR